MTPAIKLLTQTKVTYHIHEYDHDPRVSSYGLEVCSKLGVEASRVFKTLVIATGTDLAVAIIPVDEKLDLKGAAKVLKVKKATMADPKEVERVTGYVLGGVSPFGQKKRLQTMIERTAKDHDTIFVSAGRRGLEIELKVKDLIQLLNAKCSEITI